MKIRDKTVLVYDVEIFKNIFHVTVKDTETGTIKLFEISSRKNQLSDLVDLFKQYKTSKNAWDDTKTSKTNSKFIFAGFNNIHYDNVVINYIIDFYTTFSRLGFRDICNSLYNLTQKIIHDKDDTDSYKTWKYQKWFETLDILTLLYSQQLRVGLKEMQVTMEYPNVQDFIGDWHEELPEDRFDEMILYNINDTESTACLIERCKEDIDLRISIEDTYNVSVLNKDGVNIGMEIIKQKYLIDTGLTWNDIKDLRSPIDKIDLKEVILPIVEYRDPVLKNMLNLMKQNVVSPGRKGYKHKFIYKGLRYTVGVGGIHSENDPETIIPKDDEMLIDIDVASLYPSMIIEYGFYPRHLGRPFLGVYTNIRTERLDAKRNRQKTKDTTLKFSLNGLSGNLQNKHSFCYDPFAVMQIRINGQLLLLMLAELLCEIDCKIIQANTDGLFVLLKKNNYENLKDKCKEWENLTRLVLEEERFEAMYQFAINDYIAIKDGYTEMKKKFYKGEAKNYKGEIYQSLDKIKDDFIKTKGIFIPKVLLGKGLSPKIIPEAIINYFADGVPIKETITKCKNIKRFLQSEKTGKQWTVEYNDKVQQRTNRFYVSNNGYYLWKWKTGGLPSDLNNLDKTQTTIVGNRQYQNMLKGYSVTLLNKFTPEKDIKDYNINYSYYIAQATKIVEQIQPRQLKLFD